MRRYDHGDAWVLGRLGAGAADSVRARFLAADTEEFRVRYLTLLSYFTDPALIPLLARVYVAPDSFRIPKRYAVRASDGLLWIGTRGAMEALLGIVPMPSAASSVPVRTSTTPGTALAAALPMPAMRAWAYCT